MEERSCDKCEYMVVIRNSYCYRTPLGFSCHEERNGLIPEKFFGYIPCGMDGKFFKKKSDRKYYYDCI